MAAQTPRTQKIALAVVHGMGRSDPTFHHGFEKALTRAFQQRTKTKDREPQLVIRPVDWAHVLENDERDLYAAMQRGGPMRWKDLRRFVVDFMADAIAYQPTPWNRDTYDAVHAVFASTLKDLAQLTDPKAPLCVVAHSLGSIVSSNFMYDLQNDFGNGQTVGGKKQLVTPKVRAESGGTPLERGETFSHFFTFGSTLPLWGLRYKNPQFGKPVQVPSPKLGTHHKGLEGEWTNFYDRDDILGYPMKELNEHYRRMVTRDYEINSGGFPWSLTPKSHTLYWTDSSMIDPIAESLADAWTKLNNPGQKAVAAAPQVVQPKTR